jgi:regulator of RNase E activity RraA
MRVTTILICCIVSLLSTPLFSGLAPTKEEIVALTPNWKGERLPDGRPKVPDGILERMKKVSLEEAWGVLKGEGWPDQFEGNWQMLHLDRVIVGRALTAFYLPSRPDLRDRINALGKAEGRIGGSNSWPIDMLQKGDVYVADSYGKIADGTLIGDNLGNSIYAKSGNGVVFDGSVRDIEGLEKIDGFNAFVRGWHPSAIKDMVLGGVNTPVRIGGVTVLPGDVVLAKREGIMFIPPHLAEKIVVTAEIIQLKDEFGHLRLREGRYTPGQIDRKWTPEIVEDFFKWLDANPGKAKVSKDELQKHL